MASYQRFSRQNYLPFASPGQVKSPQQSLQRLLPVSAPQSSGPEKSVSPKPSYEELSYRSWDNTPTGSSTEVNKPLPNPPSRSRPSSVYSNDSGYTKIVASYGDEEVPTMPAIHQAIAYLSTKTGLLSYDDTSSHTGVPKLEDRQLRASQSIPTLQYAPFRDERWNASAHELSEVPISSAFRNRVHEPVSPVSIGSWQQRLSPGFLSPPMVSPPLVHSNYHLSHDYERQYLPGPMSASVTEIIDPRLVPRALRMSKAASMIFDSRDIGQVPSSDSLVSHVELLDIKEAQRRAVEAKQRDMEARATEYIARRANVQQSNLIDLAEAQRRQKYDELQKMGGPYETKREPRPRSISSDSFVIYTGVRESVKAIIKHKIKQKKESRELEKAAKVQERQRKGIISVAEHRYPAMKDNTPASPEQVMRYSWTGSSGRASMMDGVSNLLRNLSISKAQREDDNNRGRRMERGRRPKQLAVLPSPYQKYGADVWLAKNKKARRNLQARPSGILRVPTKKAATKFVTRSDLSPRRPALNKKRSEEMRETYLHGASRLRTVLGVDDNVADKGKEKKGRMLGFGRTMSEVRRERLKRSIAVLGPARQPVAMQVDESWL